VTNSSDPEFLEALKALNRALEELGSPSMVIGGVAVIALGVPRYTADIDAAILGRSSFPEQILEAFAKHSIGPREKNVLEFARSKQVILALHEPSGVSIDAALAWLPFEEEAIQSSRSGDYMGVRLRIPRPEDLVIYKLVAARPQDIEDAKALLALYGSEINLERVRDLMRQFSEVLEDTSRLEILERLIQKTS
jgi:hypothetical protein